MNLNFNSILLSTDNLERLVDFYSKVFVSKPAMQEEGYAGFLVGGCFFGLGTHDKVHGKNPNPERIILNFECKEVKKEFERIKKSGAGVVAEPYELGGAWIATLEDPDGNYFQLMTPWEDTRNGKKN